MWNVGYSQWQASPHQKLSSFEQAARSYVYAKIAFLFFLLIYSWVWRAGFLDTTVCLDNAILSPKIAAHLTIQSFFERLHISMHPEILIENHVFL